MTTGSGTTTYSWSYDNRLLGVTYPSTNSNSYSYNGVGSRVSASGVGGSKTFRRDGVGVTSPLLSDGTNAITPGISTRASSTTKFMHGGLKNSTAQSNSGQSITGTKTFDAFGNQLASTGSWTGMLGYGGAYGYQTDDELKLLGHRYYDSSIGRFLTRDPIKDGRNWYAYCENNPTSNSDPSGLSASDRIQAALDIVLHPTQWRDRWRNRDGTDQTDACPFNPSHGPHPRYTDCGRFVSAIVSASDSLFPTVGSSAMLRYIRDKSSGSDGVVGVRWEMGEISGGGFAIGDVVIRSGHVGLIISVYDEWIDKDGIRHRRNTITVAEASFGDHRPELRKYETTALLDGSFDYWGRPIQ